MSRSIKVTPTVVELVEPAPTTRTSAEIIVMPVDEIGRKRIQRADPLARAYGSDAPDLKAKAPKQTEKRVPGLQDDDIDYANCVVHLWMTKAGEAQTLPLTNTVASILEALKPLRRPANPHLFPAKSGAGHMAAPYKRLRQVLAAAGLEMAGFHLFRKTVATQAMQLPGMDVLTVSRLLRHKSVRTLEVHYLATPHKRLRQAANDIGEVLLARRGGGAS